MAEKTTKKPIKKTSATKSVTSKKTPLKKTTPTKPVSNASPKTPLKKTNPTKPVSKVSPKTPLKKTTPTKSVSNASPKTPLKKTTPTKSVSNASPKTPLKKTSSPKKQASKPVVAKKTTTKSTVQNSKPEKKTNKEKTSAKVSNTKKSSKKTTSLLKTTKLSSTTKPLLSKLAKKMVLPFEVGESVFYPNDGIGHIIGTEDRELQGTLTPYYIIRFPAQKMTNHLPIKNCKMVKLRKTASKKIAKKILKIFEQESPINNLSWKDRLLMYQEINNEGHIVEMAKMLTSLYSRRRIKNQLSFQERQIYEFVLEAISNELAIALKLSNEESKTEILSLLSEAFERQQ